MAKQYKKLIWNSEAGIAHWLDLQWAEQRNEYIFMQDSDPQQAGTIGEEELERTAAEIKGWLS